MIKVTIAQAAKKKGYQNPTQLANLMKKSPTVIWRYWEGHQTPGLDMLDRICDALDCELSDLIVRNGKRKRK